MLHRPFQLVQIHRTQAMRQRHVQQFMFRHHRFTLEDMGDGMVQGLVFHQGNPWQAARMRRGTKCFEGLPFIRRQLRQLPFSDFRR